MTAQTSCHATASADYPPASQKWVEISVFNAVMDRSRASGSVLALLLSLSRWADARGRCWVSVQTIAKFLRMSERGAQKVIERAVADQELSVEVGAGPHGCNILTIRCVDPAFDVDLAPGGEQAFTPREQLGAEGVNGRSPELTEKETIHTRVNALIGIWNAERGRLPGPVELTSKREDRLRHFVRSHGNDAEGRFRDAVKIAR